MFSTTTSRLVRRPNAEAVAYLWKRRAWYEGEADAPPPVSDIPGNVTDPKDGQQTSGKSTPSSERTLTQAEVDRIVGDTRKTARTTAVNDLLKDLGFERQEDLKALVATAKKRADDEMSEAEKAKAAREAAERERDEARQSLDAERLARRIEKRDSALLNAARDAKAQHSEDVLVWVQAFAAADLEKAMGDDGMVDMKQVGVLIEKAKAARPAWFGDVKRSPGSPSNAGGKTPDANASAKADAAREQFKRMKSSF